MVFKTILGSEMPGESPGEGYRLGINAL